MKNANCICMDVTSRVDSAIRKSMDIYINKLMTKYIDTGLENAFQMHLAEIVSKELDQLTFFCDERFVVKFEKNIPINNNNDYIDIVVEYKRGSILKQYLIELKFKKETDSAPDLGNIYSYIDIYNLDCHKKNTSNVEKCYFIFLTDYEVYTKGSKRGTRFELPMFDCYTIKANTTYTVTGNSAKKNTLKYPNGFIFSKDYYIEYQKAKINNKDFWFYILEI